MVLSSIKIIHYTYQEQVDLKINKKRQYMTKQDEKDIRIIWQKDDINKTVK